MVKLLFLGKAFQEATSTNQDAEAVLEIDDTKKQAKLSYSPDASMVAQRTARRQAEGICKTGFQLKDGSRVGIKCHLDVEGEKSVDERLLQEGHKYK